jgi:ketosteroid isomerase-like protein
MSATAAVLDRFLAAWSRRDLAGVLDCLAADVVYSSSDGSVVHGREAVGAVFAEQLDGDPDLTIEPVAVRGERGFGYFSYPAATDGTTLRGVDVYTVRDGLIVAKDVLSKIA